ncbi:MAG: single-stranded DNA-binding protein [Acholeplasmatales bacterium]|jgi:single-strand DNA-binding protein|nr:single-stranded DNA-binding protein [Acholeplasmatales bacterium]
MINKVILVGRITRDPEVKVTTNGINYVLFTLAINRRFKSNSGEREADFINCTAWSQSADFMGKYIKKGALLGVDGALQSRRVDDNGQPRTIIDVRVENVTIIDNNQGPKPEAKSESEKIYEEAQKNVGNDDLGF